MMHFLTGGHLQMVLLSAFLNDIQVVAACEMWMSMGVSAISRPRPRVYLTVSAGRQAFLNPTALEWATVALRAMPSSTILHAAVFAAEGVLSARETRDVPNGRRAKVAGVVLVRQRPGKGNAIFVTIEDETGITNALLWARDFEANRRAVMAARLLVLEGVIQRSEEGVVHLMTTRAHDRSAELARLSPTHALEPPLMPVDAVLRPHLTRSVTTRSRDPRHGHPRPTHPRDVRIMPPSRDFH